MSRFFRFKPQSSKIQPPNPKLIVGLGNIGKDYENTRHNAGFLAVRWLAKEYGVESVWAEKKRLKAVIAADPARGVILAQPTTMMNDSGQAVRALMDFYKLAPADVTIIHDDADLELGDIRLVESTRTGAGHHGVLSVIQHIGPSFKRIRIGIGRPDQPVRDISNFVLSRLSPEDKVRLNINFNNLEKYLSV